MSRIVILADGPAIVRHASDNPEPGALIIACTRRAAIACDHLGLERKLIDDFCDTGEIVSFTLENYRKITEATAAWDKLLHEEVPALKERGLTPFKYSTYHLKLLIDTLSAKILQLRRLMEKYPDAEMRFISSFLPTATLPAMDIPEQTNLTAVIIQELLVPQHILSANKARALAIPSTMPSVASHPLALGTRLKSFAKTWVKNSALYGKLHPRSFPWFEPGHDLYALMSPLKTRGFYPERLDGSVLPSADPTVSAALDRAWRRLSASSLCRDFFTVADVDYFPLLQSRLQRLVTTHFAEAVTAYDQARKHLATRKRQRHFALTGTLHVDAISRARMKACQDQGLTLVTYQEGGGYGICQYPIQDYCEMQDGDVFLCYGEGNLNYYKERPHRKKLILPVGSAHQDRVAAKYSALKKLPMPQAIRRIMYVGTNIDENKFHSPSRGLSATWIYRSQIKILDALAELSGKYEILLKLHPLEKDMAAHVRYEPKYAAFSLLEGRFEDHLAGIDLFIIDFPSTTALVAAHTNAHILVLAEPGATPPFTAENKMLWQSRVHLFHDLETFCDSLRAFARRPTDFEFKNSDAFLRAYGTHLGDGRSAERAAQYLTTLVHG